eukprot:m.447917 g.447917  ORF g.447917 m.447917 type:complete len:501 (+) comp19578_c0_seq1:162-1664(+)
MADGEPTLPACRVGDPVTLHGDTLKMLQDLWSLAGDDGITRLDATLCALTAPPSIMSCRFDVQQFEGIDEAVTALQSEVEASEIAAIPNGALGANDASLRSETPHEDADSDLPAATDRLRSGPTPACAAEAPESTGASERLDTKGEVPVWQPIRHHALPDVLTMPCIGPRPTVTPTQKEVVVGLLCGMSVLRGAPVFAPGVLAVSAGVAAGDEVSVWADVDGKCRRGTSTIFGGRKLFVGNGMVSCSRAAFFREDSPSGIYVTITEPLYSTPRFGGSVRFVLQNLPSCCAGHELEVEPGLAVLDMCAAPGGKTMHLATLMSGIGTLVAVERSGRRAAALHNLLAETHPWVKVHKMDATAVIGPEYPPGFFDRVLLDAPCTGLGQRPRLRQGVRAADLTSTPRLQRKLLAVGAEALKPGGVLVYSTCTINPLENERVVAWALGQSDKLGLQLLAPKYKLGQPGLSGQGLDPDQCNAVQRFDPANDSAVIGFFVARFRKRAE